MRWVSFRTWLLLAAAMGTLCNSAFAQETPCKFILGYAEPKPDWFTVTGEATLRLEKGKLIADLYDERLQGKKSHIISVRLQGKNASGTLVNLFSDEGPNSASGSYQARTYVDGEGKKLVRSLVVQNAFMFAAVTCYAKAEP